MCVRKATKRTAMIFVLVGSKGIVIFFFFATNKLKAPVLLRHPCVIHKQIKAQANTRNQFDTLCSVQLNKCDHLYQEYIYVLCKHRQFELPLRSNINKQINNSILH